MIHLTRTFCIIPLFISFSLSSEIKKQGGPPSDFLQFSIQIDRYADQVALQAIQDGRANNYIGNPGIINDLEQTPLTVLIKGNTNPNIIKKALNAGADPNKHSYWKNSGKINSYPLELALEYGNEAVAKILLEYGADKNLISLERTLISAIKFSPRTLDCIKLLIDLGADPHKNPIYRSGYIGENSAIDELKKNYAWEKEPEKYEEALRYFHGMK